MADLTPITREEKIIAGEDIKPVTREEKILAGMDVVPVTRREKFLKAFGGGGSGEKIKLTDASYFHYDDARCDFIGILDSSETKIFKAFFAAPGGIDTSGRVMPYELDTSNGTDFSRMFCNRADITSIPALDTSNGTDFNSMFGGCSKLTSIPALDVSNGTDFNSMFGGCSKLTSIPALDTRNGTDFSYMFRGCSILTSIPALDTRNGTNFSYMFNYCSKLASIPALDVSNGTGFSSMFNYCSNLTDLFLYNIHKSIQIGSGTSYGHLLTVDSLVHTIKELRTVKSTQKLTMGSANLEKIANLYCKIIDDTHEKKTMELCESTDEGAMTLIDYAALKGWQIL